MGPLGRAAHRAQGAVQLPDHVDAAATLAIKDLASALGKEKGGQKRKEEPEPVDEGPKFLAFAGGGNRLDGKSSRPDLKPVEVDVPTTSLNIPKEFERFIRGPKPEGGEKKKEEGEGGKKRWHEVA